MAAWPIHLATLVALALTSLPERVRVEGPDCFSLALPASPASPRIASVHTAFVPKLVELAQEHTLLRPLRHDLVVVLLAVLLLFLLVRLLSLLLELPNGA